MAISTMQDSTALRHQQLKYVDIASPHLTISTNDQQAVEVYESLVTKSPEDPPDLVIGADTIVVLPAPSNLILEKPKNVLDQIQMLEDCNGCTVKIITAVTLGTSAMICSEHID